MIKKIIKINSLNCIGAACPSIFEYGKNSYIIIGKIFTEENKAVQKKIGEGEIAIEVPKKLFNF